MQQCEGRPVSAESMHGTRPDPAVIKSGKPFDARIPMAGLAIQDGI